MDEDPTLLGPFARDGDDTVGQIEVVDIETAQLGHPDTARIEELEHRVVAHVAGARLRRCAPLGAGGRMRSGRRREEPVELGVPEHPGQPGVR